MKRLLRWWRLPFGFCVIRLPTQDMQLPCEVSVLLRVPNGSIAACLARLRTAAMLFPNGTVAVTIEYSELVQAVMWRVDEHQNK